MPSAKILPPDKPYVCLYSLFALRYCFEEQKATEKLSATSWSAFLRSSVIRLCEALTRGSIETPSQAPRTRVAVTNDLLGTLKVMLQGQFLGSPLLVLFFFFNSGAKAQQRQYPIKLAWNYSHSQIPSSGVYSASLGHAWTRSMQFWMASILASLTPSTSCLNHADYILRSGYIAHGAPKCKA